MQAPATSLAGPGASCHNQADGSTRMSAFLAKPAAESEFITGDWTIRTVKDRILKSVCAHDPEHKVANCEVCLFNKQVSLPSLPDMLFARNLLSLKHVSGGRIEFKAVSALKRVDATQSNVKVSASDEWTASRAALTQHMHKGHDFDWTFTTDYSGDVQLPLVASATSERIDMNALKVQEPILFYDEISLFEDEMDDHGSASLNVRVRVMQTGWFVLLRYYLRVDGVLLRINDTRLRWCKQNAAVLVREWSCREAKWDELSTAARQNALQADKLWMHLPVIKETIDQIQVKQ